MGSKINYAAYLQEAMAAAGMGQTELAAATGIPKSTISQYANGYTSPSPERERLISDALGAKPKEPPEEPGGGPFMSVEDAARIMGKSAAFVREGLKQGRIPFGYAVKMPGGKWSFWIGRSKFMECTGLDAGDASAR